MPLSLADLKPPRFALVDDDGTVLRYHTWEQARDAFPIETGSKLVDNETGRVWHPGARPVWEDAQT